MIESGAVLYLVGAAITTAAYAHYVPPQVARWDAVYALAVVFWPRLWWWVWVMARRARDRSEGS